MALTLNTMSWFKAFVLKNKLVTALTLKIISWFEALVVKIGWLWLLL